jgi:nitrogen-specific signal transduction histidine kinase
MMDDLFRPLVSRKRGGMGIGLSLCRSIIEAHGGCIEAQNTAKGAEVRFRLPIAPIGS